MTREEAIKKWIVPAIEKTWNDTKCKEIIKALEQEPCDAVSRKAAVNACLNGWNKDYKEIVADIKALPSVIPAEKVGHWEWVQYDSNPNIGNWHCSKCRTIIPHMPEETDNTPIYKWCPMCGAKIREEEDT